MFYPVQKSDFTENHYAKLSARPITHTKGCVNARAIGRLSASISQRGCNKLNQTARMSNNTINGIEDLKMPSLSSRKYWRIRVNFMAS